jgi:hypothetical protein
MTNTVYERPASSWSTFFGISFRGTFDAWQPASDLFLWLARILRPLYPGSATIDERYFLAMFIFVLFALVILIANSRRSLHKTSNMALIPLAAGCGIQILSYTTSAYGGAKEWYWISQMILVTLAGSLLIDLILRPLQHLPFQKIIGTMWRGVPGKIKSARLILEVASVLLGLSFAYQFSNHVTTVMRHNYFPADRPYMEVLPFLEENTSPGSIIGMTGGGNVGYFIRNRTIVNMDGLINSNDYFHALKNREAPIYLHEHGVEIIFANAQLLTVPPYYGQFARYLERFNTYGGKGLYYLLKEPKN